MHSQRRVSSPFPSLFMSNRDPSASFTFTTTLYPTGMSVLSPSLLVVSQLWSKAACTSMCVSVCVCVYQGQVWTKQMVKPTPHRLVAVNYFQCSRCCCRLNTQLMIFAEGSASWSRAGPLNNTTTKGEGWGQTLIQQPQPDSNYLDVDALIIIEDDRCLKQFVRKLPVRFRVWLPVYGCRQR